MRVGCTRAPAPANTLRRCLLAVRTADSHQSGIDATTASCRSRAVASRRSLARGHEQSRQRFCGITFSPHGVRPRESRHFTPTHVASVQSGQCPACRRRDRREGSSCGLPTERMCFFSSPREAVLRSSLRSSPRQCRTLPRRTAAGRAAAVFQAVPAVSEDQSGGRIPPRTSSGKIWQCLGSVWQCVAVLNPSYTLPLSLKNWRPPFEVPGRLRTRTSPRTA
jgi:hypothetical protein